MIDTVPQLVTSGCPTEVNVTMPVRPLRCTRDLALSGDRRIEVPAVENQIVPNNEPDFRRAQERAGIAELRRIADAARGRIFRLFLH
jgi:hypothetical protein